MHAFRLLPRAERRKFCLVVIIQVATSLLDVVGVLLIGAVGVLAVQSAGGTPGDLPAPLSAVVTQLQRQGYDLKQITLGFAMAAALFFVMKSLISGILGRRVLIFLAHRQAQISVNLFSRLLNQSATDIQHRSTLTTAYAVIQGVAAAVIGILGSVATIVSESALLILFAVMLLVINPSVTVTAALFLGSVAFIVYRVLGSWSSQVGMTNAQTAIRGNMQVQDTLATFREISVLDRRGLYVARIKNLMSLGSRSQADGAFINQVPKLVFEAALVVGSVLLAGFLFVTENLTQAVATMVLFLAAGSRVLPSIMRLQAAVVSIRSSAGSSMETFRLAERVALTTPIRVDERSAAEIRDSVVRQRVDFIPSIQLEDVGFQYPGSSDWAIQGVDLEVSAGASLAVVGSTGAGKSTLADVLIGALDPTTGRVSIGGQTPREAIRIWPGAISYIPQHVSLVEGSVRENVALGLPEDTVTDDEIWDALARAHVANFLREQRQGLDTRVGERGLRLSGGQRQRLGIARALLFRPQLLVMDEATSALDAQTEKLVGEVVGNLHGATTLIVIAHRLATVRDFDAVAYLAHGRVEAIGTFSEVRKSVSDFDLQARLLGL